ncbi:MAG: hypothetical protein J6Q22_09480 [Prevotella sp.]|nr:hypothetical protein [Prevotella sp.]
MKTNKRTESAKAKRKVFRDTTAATEACRRARLERESKGIFKAKFMRLTLTEDAYRIVSGMDNSEFRHFASAAIRKAARRR